MHSSVQRTTNARLLLAWTAGSILLLGLFPSAAFLPEIVGACFGLLVGSIQAKTLRSNSLAFARATTAMEVRSAFTATRIGKLAVGLQWLGVAAVAIVSFVRSRDLVFVGFIASYLAFMLAREAVSFSALRFVNDTAEASINRDDSAS